MSDLSIVAVIPLFNGARWIESSIASVFAQTRRPDEFIVVDDGSTDNGPAIAERMGVQVIYKTNGGQSSARNYGVRNSKSDLIALLDMDDGWYPSHLEELIKPFCRKYQLPLGWTYSNLDRVTEKGEMFCRNYLDDIAVEKPKRNLIRCLSENMMILPSASLISRQAFEAVGGFDERLCGYEDDDLFLRIFCARFHNVYIPKSLSYWTMNDGSVSYSTRMAKSRRVYAIKCLAAFPNNELRDIWFQRDCTGPKFFRHGVYDYIRAVRAKDYPVARRALQDMRELAPHLRRRSRLAFYLASPLLHFPSIARFVLPAAIALGAKKIRL